MKYLFFIFVFILNFNFSHSSEYYFTYKNEFSIQGTKDLLEKFKKDLTISNIKISQTKTGFIVEWTQKEILDDF